MLPANLVSPRKNAPPLTVATVKGDHSIAAYRRSI